MDRALCCAAVISHLLRSRMSTQVHMSVTPHLPRNQATSSCASYAQAFVRCCGRCSPFSYSEAEVQHTGPKVEKSDFGNDSCSRLIDSIYWVNSCRVALVSSHKLSGRPYSGQRSMRVVGQPVDEIFLLRPISAWIHVKDALHSPQSFLLHSYMLITVPSPNGW